MEILILIVALVAVVLWVKHQFPNAGISIFINSLIKPYPASRGQIPEDSVLRRHYLTELEAQRSRR